MKKIIVHRQANSQTVDLPTDMPPVLKRVYAARGVKNNTDLERELQHLLPFDDLLGIDKAVAVLIESLTQDKRILIIGDFDADGATSTAIAVRGLRLLGAKYVDYLVPNRFEYGYGLTPEIVDVATEKKPDIIITVDNGISSVAGVARAQEKNIMVVITDHHLAGDELPAAAAIVNPNQPGDHFASKSLAGCGVIFYVLLALRKQLRELNWFSQNNCPEPNLAKLLDIVALGTVADVVPLDKNNRILVYQGVRRIRAGQCVPGIKALLTVAKREYQTLVAQDLGYVVGPRLNAAGRLDDMSLGIECLLCDDDDKALQIAEELDALNQERRVIEQEMKQQAIEIVNKLSLSDKQMPTGLCLFDESWHQGVIGIVASRIKDRLHRPVIAFALADDDTLKGSARSINGLHIRDTLDAIAKHHPQLIQKFGGHAMAAGLTIKREDLKAFRKAFNEEVEKQLNTEDLCDKILSDGELQDNEFELQLADTLREAGPWGQHFPEPVFDGEFVLVDQRIVGSNHLKLVLQTKPQGQLLDAIAFNVDLEKWPNYRANSVKLAYRLDVNEFRGRRSLQLIAEYIEAS